MRAFTSSVASSASDEASNVDTVPEQSCFVLVDLVAEVVCLSLDGVELELGQFRLVPCSGLGLQVVGSLRTDEGVPWWPGIEPRW